MSTHQPPPAQQPQQGRAVQLSDQLIDPEWHKRWQSAAAKYPPDLLEYAGQVRALFNSPAAPLRATDGKVFIVYREDPAAAQPVSVQGVYATVPAANEHVLLCFAAAYGAHMAAGDARCVWSVKGASGEERAAVAPGSVVSAEMVWSYTPHACLELEVVLLAEDEEEDGVAGRRRVFIVEEWIEDEPPEELEMRVLGKRL